MGFLLTVVAIFCCGRRLSRGLGFRMSARLGVAETAALSCYRGTSSILTVSQKFSPSGTCRGIGISPVSAYRRGDLEIKVRLFDQYEPVHNPSRFSSRLVAIEEVTHDISEFRFETQSSQAFEPGQFALIDVPGVAGSRAYSMCNIGGGDGVWDFQIKRVPGGAATTALFDDAKVGLECDIIGPYGRGYFRGFRGRDIVLIAGGSGLSPMVSVARAIEAASSARTTEQVSFYYGGRAAEDIAGEQFLSVMPGYGDWISYEVALTDKSGTDDSRIFQGFVHELAKQRLDERLNEVDLYFAGPPLMAGAVEQEIVRHYRVPSDQVFYDRYG